MTGLMPSVGQTRNNNPAIERQPEWIMRYGLRDISFSRVVSAQGCYLARLSNLSDGTRMNSQVPTSRNMRATGAKIHVAIGPALYRMLFIPGTTRVLRSLGKVVFQSPDERVGTDQLASMLGDCRVLITGWTTPPLTPAVLAAAPRLQLVAHTGVSLRPLLDRDFFLTGVRATNTGDSMVVPVAEFTVMQILRALRHTVACAAPLPRGPDSWSVWKNPNGTELSGCPVGVVGAGQIGRRVIGYLRAFDANVFVYDPLLPESAARAMGVTPLKLRELLKRSRVVSLHAPSLPATKGMLGARELAAMPDGSWLINTARSSLVDSTALLRELESGRISAALDVFDQEPLPGDSPLRGLPNVMLTPHAAFMTRECLRRLGDVTVEEIRQHLAGKPLQNEVTARMYETMA
jgi:phosphoglycerate dehydrogenase-like enzyme